MQQLEGALLIGVALLLLWIVITGRYQQFIEAIGLVKGTPKSASVAPSASAPIAPSYGAQPIDFLHNMAEF